VVLPETGEPMGPLVAREPTYSQFMAEGTPWVHDDPVVPVTGSDLSVCRGSWMVAGADGSGIVTGTESAQYYNIFSESAACPAEPRAVKHTGAAGPRPAAPKTTAHAGWFAFGTRPEVLLQPKSTWFPFGTHIGESHPAEEVIIDSYAPPAPETYQVFVVTFEADRRTQTFNVDATFTTRDLKMCLWERLGYSPSTLTIQYGGRMMVDSRLLTDYGVKKESTIELRVFGSGGAPPRKRVALSGAKTEQLSALKSSITGKQLSVGAVDCNFTNTISDNVLHLVTTVDKHINPDDEDDDGDDDHDQVATDGPRDAFVEGCKLFDMKAPVIDKLDISITANHHNVTYRYAAIAQIVWADSFAKLTELRNKLNTIEAVMIESIQYGMVYAYADQKGSVKWDNVKAIVNDLRNKKFKTMKKKAKSVASDAGYRQGYAAGSRPPSSAAGDQVMTPV
jgi:hypothetical protein